MKSNINPKRNHIILLLLSLLIYTWSAINPYDRQSWFLLSLPGVLLITGLILTYRRFTFSTFVYVVVFLHLIILFVGAKYTYTENPLFNTLIDLFNFERNDFDRVGHFAQGFTPALMAREVLSRKENMKHNLMFLYFILSASMGVSAMYELCEYSVSFVTNIPGDVILGLQGDVFDTHKDILMALIGALTAMIFFGKYQDKRPINKIPHNKS